ncbi:MAG: tRNA adenosine(34) deaminase TadA [Victivallaceae bacterium]|nr:tRNA adenosine(34) deaminase TadA [Victivallaceae bacterium]
MIIFDDEYYMRLALNEAQNAFDKGEVPVGAVVVCDGRIIARAWNQVEMLKDATAHAEILAITQAAAALGDWRLENAEIYVTKEPCAMCAGAMVNSRVKRVVFGLSDPRSGAAGGALDVTGFSGMLHNVAVKSGVLEAECKALLQDFFKLVRCQR